MTGWSYPRLLVHRCGGALAPENTLAGLRLAARLGCRAVEFDTMLSADGVPMLIHDENLERTTNGHGLVAEQTAAALRALDAGVGHHSAFREEPIPCLAEALALCQELGLGANVEIKPSAGRDKETGRIVAKLVGQWAAGSNRPAAPLLLSSFSEAALAEAAAEAPSLPRALLVETIPDDWAERMRLHDAMALHCAAQGLDPAKAAAVAAAGVPLACYTVNDPTVAERLFACGVASVFTDRPDRFPSNWF